MKQQNTSSRPPFVRVICWILIILLLASAIYYTIWGLQALISSFLGDGEETKSAALPTPTVTVSDWKYGDRLLL